MMSMHQVRDFCCSTTIYMGQHRRVSFLTHMLKSTHAQPSSRYTAKYFGMSLHLYPKLAYANSECWWSYLLADAIQIAYTRSFILYCSLRDNIKVCLHGQEEEINFVGKLNPYKPIVLLIGHRQRVQIEIRHRIT